MSQIVAGHQVNYNINITEFQLNFDTKTGNGPIGNWRNLLPSIWVRGRILLMMFLGRIFVLNKITTKIELITICQLIMPKCLKCVFFEID